jgi:hypothetical protein
MALMRWHVQYRDDDIDCYDLHPTPEEAIEAACRHIEAGRYVYGIGAGPLANSIGPDRIALIHALWVREKFPFT